MRTHTYALTHMRTHKHAHSYTHVHTVIEYEDYQQAKQQGSHLLGGESKLAFMRGVHAFQQRDPQSLEVLWGGETGTGLGGAGRGRLTDGDTQADR